ncbi:ABC transporter substrate-binding protein [Aureimonas frigidaquae]|uniref:ABC transporter substrate-binding protein n=1 Tax=Aureimonas frigidaquae TaxID=424757 RepID=UPI0009FB7A61|nr:ABC transporter substrate-binding protein [Aureimonas frigidaquae]
MSLKMLFLAGTILAGAAAPALAEVPQLNPALSPVAGSPMVDRPKSDKESFVLGFSNISVVNTWRVQMVEELKHEASLHPEISEMIVSDAGGDVNRQVADIESLIARGVDALLVAPGSEVALNTALDKAYDAGIPVIIFSSNATPKNYTVKLLADDAQFGRDGAKYLAEALGGKGNVLAIRGISGNSIDNDRFRGVEEVFADHPDIKIIDQGFGDWAYDKGKQVCESLLIAHPDVQGVWSSGGAMTQACAEVAEENGLPMIPMTGEANNGFLRIWKEKDLQSVAPISPTWFGQQGVIAALRVLEGEPIAKDNLVNPAPITKEQIDEYYRPDLNDSYWVGSTLPDETLVEMYKK